MFIRISLHIWFTITTIGEYTPLTQMPMHPSPDNVPSLRDLMPSGFTRELMRRTRCKQRQTISDVVLGEQTGSKYWPAVEQLARETNPEGFAQWQAAQAQEVAAS